MSSDWHSVMPRCAAVITTRIIASASTHHSTGAISTSLPAVCVRVAWTTLSTMRAPTQATAEGSTPASMVTKASRNDSLRLVLHSSSSARLL